MSEKALARALHVQFTPTILILDEAGTPIVRLDGYYPPHRFEAVLDYAAGRLEKRRTLADYLRTAVKDAASPALHDEPFFMRAPYDLRRGAGARPLAVLFETPGCDACEEMHREAFHRAEVRAQLARFDVARFSPAAATPLVTPDGRSTTARELARDLGIAYTPAFVFFDEHGIERFRIDSYLRPFHLASSLDYVASGAYRDEPSFQRFVQARAARLRDAGESVDLWR
jgi:thioredoxin-related protein